MTVALCVHHDPDSSLGSLATTLAARGFEVTNHEVGTGLDDPAGSSSFPDLDELRPDLVVVMGSRWSVIDPACAHWVEPEVEMLRRADELAIPVVGICFGAQILAAALGGSVEAAPRLELGWMAIEPSGDGPSNKLAILSAAQRWFEWHGDRVTPPAGATVLARTDTAVQAFTLRRNFAIQFHPEVDRDVLELWLAHDRDHVVELGYNVEAILEQTDTHAAGAAGAFAELFDRWWSDVWRDVG